jgi:type II restriction enzyme
MSSIQPVYQASIASVSRITSITTTSPGVASRHHLVKAVVEEFGPRWTPGGTVLYVGDTDQKYAYIKIDRLAELGITLASGDKPPDVVIELQRLFANATVGLVFVTAFLTRRRLAAYLTAISWETEVWVADASDHLIHFDGERFLGPYPGR